MGKKKKRREEKEEEQVIEKKGGMKRKEKMVIRRIIIVRARRGWVAGWVVLRMMRVRIGNNEEKREENKRVGWGGRSEEGEKFECRFEEIGKKKIIMEMGKGVVKMFLIFEGELYTFVMMRLM